MIWSDKAVIIDNCFHRDHYESEAEASVAFLHSTAEAIHQR